MVGGGGGAACVGAAAGARGVGCLGETPPDLRLAGADGSSSASAGLAASRSAESAGAGVGEEYGKTSGTGRRRESSSSVTLSSDAGSNAMNRTNGVTPRAMRPTIRRTLAGSRAGLDS